MDDWDWELLHDSQETEVETDVKIEEKPRNLASSSDDDTGVIRSDYFSLDSHHKYVEEEEDSSDNPSWIDPSGTSLAGRGERISSNSSTNSDSTDPSDSRNLLLLIDPHSDCAVDYSGANGSGNGVEIDDTTFNTQEEGGEEHVEDGSVVDHQQLNSNSNSHSSGSVVEEGEENGSGTFSESNEEKKVVWWRVPLEVLRYCVLRVSPVWSLSMAAAAVMGFVLLRRRYLYKMKRKTLGLQLKVIVDDKVCTLFPLLIMYLHLLYLQFSCLFPKIYSFIVNTLLVLCCLLVAFILLVIIV